MLITLIPGGIGRRKKVALQIQEVAPTDSRGGPHHVCGYRLSKNHRRQVIKKQNPNSRRKLIIATSAAPRREGWNPRLNITAITKTLSMKVASQYYCSTKTQSPKPASHVKLDAEFEARVSEASPQWQNARPKTRISVITALITGSITAHVIRELTPIMEYF